MMLEGISVQVRSLAATMQRMLVFSILGRLVGEKACCRLPFRSLEAFFRPQETLRPLREQPVAALVKVHQLEGRVQPCAKPDCDANVLGKRAIRF
jgi:hypothetical protein